MRQIQLWNNSYLPSDKTEEQEGNLEYLSKANSHQISKGCKSLLYYLIKQPDIKYIKTEVSIVPNNNLLKTDIIVYFTNGIIRCIEWNGNQHFFWSDWYSNIKKYTDYNENLMIKETECINKGYGCLNCNDFRFKETVTSFIIAKKVGAINASYDKLMASIESGYCYELRKALDELKKDPKIINFNIKVRGQDLSTMFLLGNNPDVNNFMLQMVNDKSFEKYI